jgi:DNA-binding protein YbaB
MMDKAKMMADAFRLRKALESEVVQIEEDGVKVCIGGDFRIRSIHLDDFENVVLKDVINKALKKVQENAALKLKELSDLNNLLD